VPTALLTQAHARIDQSSAVAQASGPALAGALVAVIGAAWAVVIDAASYLFSGVMLLTVRVEEPRAAPQQRTSLVADMGEGLRWVYRHAKLAPFALNTHAWFICSGVAGAVLVPFALRTLQLGAFMLGLALSIAGIGALVGSLAAPRLGQRFGAGWTIIASRALIACAYACIALASGTAGGLLLFGLGQFLVGLSMGASNSNEMGYRQVVTPDRLQGRMNATMRSINRAMIVVAAPLGGLLGDAIGYRLTLWFVAAGFTVVALTLGLSRFRSARLDEAAPT
jgi:predicted MFS family arabinose efflux permease